MRKTNGPTSHKTVDAEFQWRNVFFLIICAAVITTGFFFAARLHFSAMELGIRNSELKKQLGDLEAEQRRLLLAKEVALAPGSIRKAAQLAAARRSRPAAEAELASAKTSSSPKADVIVNVESKPQSAQKVIKTSMTGTTAATLAKSTKAPLKKKAEAKPESYALVKARQ